jgi:transposase-like protein
MPKGIYKRTQRHLRLLCKQIKHARKEYPRQFKKTCIKRYLNGETLTNIANDMKCSSYIIGHWVKKEGHKLTGAQKNTTHLKKLSETEKAYIGGLIDGEGSIVIVNAKGRARWLQVGIANTDTKMMDFCFKKLGGHVVLYSMKNRPNCKPCYTWRATCHEGLEVIKIILPYLITKKEKAIKAIKYFS